MKTGMFTLSAKFDLWQSSAAQFNFITTGSLSSVPPPLNLPHKSHFERKLVKAWEGRGGGGLSAHDALFLSSLHSPQAVCGSSHAGDDDDEEEEGYFVGCWSVAGLID